VSCSSGYFLSNGQSYSPQDWEAPSKEDGVRWALHLSAAGLLSFSCARPGESLEWSERKWNGEPTLSASHAPLTIAVLLQPHNRRDSEAKLIIEEVGHFF
jgi:hypothetical protein